MAPNLTRAQSLGVVRMIVIPKFPGAAITTNDDANPATPMSVTAAWRRGTIVKSIRADTLQTSPEEFARKAVRLLSTFQETNVPSQYHTKQD